MWQTSYYDDYCWDLMVSTIAISCKRFAGLRTARKEVNNTIPIINASGKIGILHAVPQKLVMRLAKTTQCIGSPMIQPKIIPLTAYVIASATIIFMSCWLLMPIARIVPYCFVFAITPMLIVFIMWKMVIATMIERKPYTSTAKAEYRFLCCWTCESCSVNTTPPSVKIFSISF